MAFLLVTGHPTTDNVRSDTCQDTIGTAIPTVLPAEVENADALRFDETDVVALFDKRN